MTPREILALCREKEVRTVDLRLVDLSGRWTHLALPVSRLDEELFEEGLGFDGSRWWGGQPASASDLLAVPQPETAFLDPVAAAPTLALLCNVQDPLTREPVLHDSRQIAQRAENYLRSTGFADAASIGAKAAFFLFDVAEFASSAAGSHCRMQPMIDPSALLAEMMHALSEAGLQVESHLQARSPWEPSAIGLARQSIVAMADALLSYKHVIRQVARRHGKRATFMPQPLAEGLGAGLHVHFSFWKKEQPTFAGHSYAGLSEQGLYALGGVLRHAPALMAICNPTTNSYKRLAAGGGAAQLAYSQQNRAVACRIPAYSSNPKSRRIAFCTPDPSCNPYLAFAAIVLAAIDGIQLKLNPGQPAEEMGGNGGREPTTGKTMIPNTLDEALRALEEDQDFLLRDDVFTADVLRTWIEHKRLMEIHPLRQRPHPFEFGQYFDG